jgi:hypothetical protein
MGRVSSRTSVFLAVIVVLYSSSSWAVRPEPVPLKDDPPPAPASPAAAEDQAKIEGTEQKIEQAGSQAPGKTPETPSAGQQISEAAQSCKDGIETAKKACLENFSPILRTTIPMISGFMTALSAASGAQDKCQKQNDFMDAAQKAMTAYNAACSGAKLLCLSRCSKAASQLKQVSGSTCPSEASAAAASAGLAYQAKFEMVNGKCKATSAEVDAVVAEGKSTCAGFEKNLAAGLGALAGMIANAKQAEQCQKDVAQKPNQQQETLDCNKPENASNPRCICEKNPRTAGCAGAPLNNPTDPVRKLQTSTDNNSGNPSLLDSPSSDQPGIPGGDSSAAGGPSIGAFGGGPGGGKGSGGGVDNGKNPKEKSGINTNVLAGEFGGGGGAGGYRGGSGADPYGKYKSFLPKEKDGRGIASKADAAQVTGSNGLSNWEKVKLRYKENKPTLLNN